MKVPIYNYLHSPITLVLVEKDAGGRRGAILGKVPPRRMASVDVGRALPGDTLVVELSHGRVYQRIVVNKSGFRAIHVGQVTTRYEQGRNDLNQPTANAVQGLGWVHLHNQTDLPLLLNGGISVPPHAMFRYRGTYAYGVPLGSKFTDSDGLHDAIRLDKPVTDVYYGFTSDLQQARFGGFMLGEAFPSDREPTYLSNEGYFT